MILCLITLTISIIWLVSGSVILYKTRDSYDTPIFGIMGTVLGASLTIIMVVVLIVVPIECNEELATFIAQKEYIENYEPTSEYDAAGIANKKIELNEWLYKVQYNKKHHPLCSFFGDEILDLEPIK